MDKKDRKTRILSIVLCMLIALPTGFLVGKIAFGADMGIVRIYIVLCISMLLAIVLQTAIHETGHMVFGLLTGYRFLSWRVLSLLIVKEDGRLKTKKFSIAGTLGQCLMGSPVSREKKPYFLYNAGGVIFNFISAAICYAAAFLCVNPLIGIFAACNGMYALIMLVSNAIPYEGSGVSNDGRNIQEMMQHPETVNTFYAMLDINEMLSAGGRLRDIPESMIDLSDTMVHAGGLGASNLIRQENVLMDSHRFDEAEKLIVECLNGNYPLLGFHRYALAMDQKYLECLNGSFEEITDKKAQKYIKAAASGNPSAIRYLYARALYLNDAEGAADYLKAFEKLKEGYPYPGEYLGESELIAIADERLKGKPDTRDRIPV